MGVVLIMLCLLVGILGTVIFIQRRKNSSRRPLNKLLRYTDLQKESATLYYSKPIVDDLVRYHHTYMRDFLAQPHKDLGRPGVVCPFIPSSIKKDCIYYGAINTKVLHEAAEIMLRYADAFHSLEPTAESKEEVYKTAILIFPALPAAEAGKFVDDLQRHLKPLFVRRHLMIGAFSPDSQFKGLHNKDFFPRAAPLASVDIRLMVPEDLKFLSPAAVSSRHSQGEAASMLRAYIARFEPSSRVLAAAYGFLRDITGANEDVLAGK